MNDIIKIGMNVKKEDNGLSIEFENGIATIVSDVLSEREEKELIKKTKEICAIIAKAIKRDIAKSILEDDLEEEMDEEFKDFLKSKAREHYDKMSDKDKERADKFERELQKTKSIDEALDLAYKTLLEIQKEEENN